MYQYKQLISPTLTLRNYNAQVGEALAGVKLMNKMLSLCMPLRGAGREAEQHLGAIAIRAMI